MTKVTGSLTVCLMLAGLVTLAGCAACFPPEPAPAAPPAPAPACGPDGEMQTVTKWLPASEPTCWEKHPCAVVKISKTAPKVVRVGQEFQYMISVENLSEAKLYDVTVWDTSSDHFRMSSATPEVSAYKGEWATWDLGTLEPGQSRQIAIDGMATSVGKITPCAEVTYRMDQVCLAIDVVEPLLKLEKMAPAQMLLCDPIPIKLVVTNTGTGQACGVVVTDPLPEGWATMDGKTTLEYNVGTLNAGESREFNAQVIAKETGTYTNMAVATADDGLRVDAAPTTTLVTKPELSVTKTGPAMRYVGRPVEFEILVSNGPEVAAENAVLVDTLPAGTTFVSASEGGTYSDGKVTWNLGTLEPRATVRGSVTVMASTPGTITNQATVTASCGRASGEASTEIQGIPAILLEVIDVEDPIEVGAQTTYVITVTNQGSAVGTNIAISATLPEEEQYVDSAGPTEAAVDGQDVTFAPLGTLAPGARATWRVNVRGVKTGDVRFYVKLKSDQMDKIAQETEATRVYE